MRVDEISRRMCLEKRIGTRTIGTKECHGSPVFRDWAGEGVLGRPAGELICAEVWSVFGGGNPESFSLSKHQGGK